MNNKEATSLVGVAPFNRESGVYQGKRMIRGGRPKIRTAMYMAMMSAIQCNSKFKDLYQRTKQESLKSSHYCVYTKAGSDHKFYGERWCHVGS